MKPTIGRIVIYRSRTGDYDLPAIITATTETLNQKGVDAGHVPPLSSEQHVHLTVFSPGRGGLRQEADNFLVRSEHPVCENVSGCYQEWDIPPDEFKDTPYDHQPLPGSWRPPVRNPEPIEPEQEQVRA